ncbi:MAG TPA: hypothetical protein PKE31_18755, partial [Pseudomonadota bacterium]|nr:hypothetical protein [Pseudomonadota bacterium]
NPPSSFARRIPTTNSQKRLCQSTAYALPKTARPTGRPADPADGTNHHLWIVIHFEPDWPAPPGSYVLANASSRPSDRACLLNGNDRLMVCDEGSARVV